MSGHRSWHRILWSVFLLATFTMAKEIYERPYSWSTLKHHQMGFRSSSLLLPVRQESRRSPIQARGFSVVSLHSDHLGNRLYWYDGLSASFNPDSSAEPDSSARFHRLSLRHWIAGSFAWLWGVTIGLDRIATFFIALLTAF